MPREAFSGKPGAASASDCSGLLCYSAATPPFWERFLRAPPMSRKSTYGARSDSVDGDLSGAEMPGEGQSEGFDRAFGEGVADDFRESDAGNGRGNIHAPATVGDPVQPFFDNEVRCVDVDGLLAEEVIAAELLNRSPECDSGIALQHTQD